MRKRDFEKENLVKKVAIDLIGKGGFENFSVNKLAKACKVSVATLYIYYQDKEDLITQLVIEEGKKMGAAMVEEFDPESSFENGLRKQWENRYRYMMANPGISKFFEQLRSSAYYENFMSAFMEDVLSQLSRFNENIIVRGEVNRMPIEVYWVMAFAPLFALIKFHNDGRGLNGKPFVITDEIVWEAFDIVVRGLKK